MAGEQLPEPYDRSRAFWENEKMVKGMFKPGQSGNPAGRAKYKSFEVVLREILHEKVDGDTDRLEVFARVVVDEAINSRNTAVIKALLDRLMPVQRQYELSLPIETDDAIDVRPVLDVSRLDEEDQASLREMARKAIARGDDQDAA